MPCTLGEIYEVPQYMMFGQNVKASIIISLDTGTSYQPGPFILESLFAKHVITCALVFVVS